MFLFFTESSSIFCKFLRLVCVLISAAGMSFPVWEFSKTHQPEKCVGLFAGKKAWRIPKLLRDTKGIHATHQKCKWLLSNLPMCFSKSAAGFWWTSLFFSRRPGAARRREGHECSIAGLCAMPETDYEFMSASMEMVRQATWNGVDVMGRLKHMHVGTGSYTCWL